MKMVRLLLLLLSPASYPIRRLFTPHHAFMLVMATSLEHGVSTGSEHDRAAARSSRRPRPRRRTLSLFAVDALVFVIFVLVVNVPLTGLAIHEWLGIALGIGFIVHLLQHGEWVVATTRRFLSASSFHNRLNYVLMFGLFSGFASIIASGLIISEVALPWIGIIPAGGSFWVWLHLGSVGWVIWLTAIHLAVNWRWIAHAADRLVFRPLSRSAGPR